MRQGRDKNGLGPEYEHIPRDASGNPVFLILPAGVRATYDRWMKNCRDGWLATEDPWAVTEAHFLTMIHRQVSPLWLDEAIHNLADKQRTKAHAKRAREASIRLLRYSAVRDAKRDGMTWEASYAEAERVWASNPQVAATADVMRKAYVAVKKDLKAGRGGRYFTPKKQNRKSLGE